MRFLGTISINVVSTQSFMKYLVNQNFSLFDDLKMITNGTIAHSASFAISMN